MARKRILSDSEVAAFCEQLGFMVKAGVTIQEGLLLLSEDNNNKRGAEIIKQLLAKVELGGALADALRDTGEFPRYMVSMVEIGEKSGRLEAVLDSLRQYYERSEAISKSIKSAVTYPLIMIIMMIVVVLIIVIKVLPVFQGVFEQLGSELSPFVQGIMDFGNAVSQYAVVIVAVIAVVILVFIFMRNSQKGSRALASMSERLFRKAAESLASGRFASAMALMLGSGMDVDQSLDMSMDLIDRPKTKEKIARIKADMAQGKAFADAVVQSGLFSGLYGKMVTVGFRTGSLDEVMSRIAMHYEDETTRSINASVSAIEPTLVAVLSLVVGLILMAVMLPLMGVMSTIG